MLTLLAKLLKALNSDASPSQISLAFVLAMIIGFTPLWSVHNLVVIFLALVIRVNFTAFLLGWGVFSGLAYLLDPAFISLGEEVLLNADLKAFWTELYRSEVWQVTRFNHTLVMGSLLVSLLLALPLFVLMNFLVRQYRDKLIAWVQKTKAMQMLKATKFYRVYEALTVGGFSL